MSTTAHDASRTAPPPAQSLAEGWVAFWNGDLGRAEHLVTDDVRIHFGGALDVDLAGDAVRGPQQLAAYVRAFRDERPGLRFALDAPPVAGGPGFAVRWSAEVGDVAVGGLDLLHVREGRIAEVWSLTGGRRFSA